MNADFSMNGKVIETERLILRPFAPEDLDDFFEYASVEGVGEMAGWSHHQDKDESQRILDIFIKGDKTFALVDKATGKLIGSLGVEALEEKARNLSELEPYFGREIGYVLSQDYWGRGLMPEAVKAVIDYLFKDLKLDFLLAGYYDYNKQSKRVLEKCGFRPYKKNIFKTRYGTEEPGVLMLLTNSAKPGLKIS